MLRALSMFGLFICFASAHVALAEGITYSAAEKLFSTGAEEGAKLKLRDVTIDGAKLRICPQTNPVTIPGPDRTDVSMAVKLWGEIAEGRDKGRYVNLQKYKWQRSQKFRLHVSSAFPVSMGVFQTYPEDRPPTKQVSPTRSVPSTFSIIPAAADYSLPFFFKTDDDLRDEIIQFTFVRGESSSCPQAPLATGDPIIKSLDDLDSVVAKGFTKLTKQAQDTDSKLVVVGPPGDMPISEDPRDVSIIMIGPGVVHLGQITLHKD